MDDLVTDCFSVVVLVVVAVSTIASLEKASGKEMEWEVPFRLEEVMGVTVAVAAVAVVVVAAVAVVVVASSCHQHEEAVLLVPQTT